jgi:hypothetical protein
MVTVGKSGDGDEIGNEMGDEKIFRHGDIGFKGLGKECCG